MPGPAPVLETPAGYGAAWRAGATGAGVRVRGLAGRVLKGRVPADFERLSHDPDRRLVFLLDSEGLGELLGRPLPEVLEQIGYLPEYVAAKRAQGFRFELLVFRARAGVHPATWDHALQLAVAEFPALEARLRGQAAALRARGFAEHVAASGGYPWHPVRDQGRGHPEFMSAARYAAGPDEAWRARALLYCEFRLTDLFAGDGFTRTPDGARGPRELLTRNHRVAELGEHIRLPLAGP